MAHVTAKSIPHLNGFTIELIDHWGNEGQSENKILKYVLMIYMESTSIGNALGSQGSKLEEIAVKPVIYTLVGNKIVDHSDVIGTSPVGAAPTTSSFLSPGFNGLGKDNCKTRQKTFNRVSSGQGKVREIPDLEKVREKSGNFVEGQGKNEYWEKWGKSQGICI